MNKCVKCGRVLSSKQALKRHLNRKNPCDKRYICDRCNQEFNNNKSLIKHVNRKNPCSTQYKCEHCKFEFEYELEYYKHYKNCDIRKKLEKMEYQLEQVSKMSAAATMIQNIHVDKIETNNQINVVCMFGQEKLSHIDATRVVKMLENNIGQFLPKMVEYVHTNPDIPENNNVVFDPELNKFYLMGKPNVWTEEDPDLTMIQLRDNIQKHIQSMQPRILPYITIKSKNNCESLLLGRREYCDMTDDTINQTKKVLENPERVEKIRAIKYEA